MWGYSRNFLWRRRKVIDKWRVSTRGSTGVFFGYMAVENEIEQAGKVLKKALGSDGVLRRFFTNVQQGEGDNNSIDGQGLAWAFMNVVSGIAINQAALWGLYGPEAEDVASMMVAKMLAAAPRVEIGEAGLPGYVSRAARNRLFNKKRDEENHPELSLDSLTVRLELDAVESVGVRRPVEDVVFRHMLLEEAEVYLDGFEERRKAYVRRMLSEGGGGDDKTKAGLKEEEGDDQPQTGAEKAWWHRVREKMRHENFPGNLLESRIKNPINYT